MPKHRPRVAQAKIHIRMAIHIHQVHPLRRLHEQGKRRRPIVHPMQRHTKQPLRLGLLRQRKRIRVQIGIALALRLLQLV